MTRQDLERIARGNGIEKITHVHEFETYIAVMGKCADGTIQVIRVHRDGMVME